MDYNLYKLLPKFCKICNFLPYTQSIRFLSLLAVNLFLRNYAPHTINTSHLNFKHPN